MDDLARGTTNIRRFADQATTGRLLGIDLGARTIGLAMCDAMQSVATPLKVLKRTKFGTDAANLSALAEENALAGIVIGFPLNMDGSEGPRVQSTRAFVRNLAPILNLPVLYWDERLTTLAADRAMLENDLSRAKRKAKIDAVAAAIILQGALERLSNERAG